MTTVHVTKLQYKLIISLKKAEIDLISGHTASDHLPEILWEAGSGAEQWFLESSTLD